MNEALCEECFAKGCVYCNCATNPTCGYCRDCKWWGDPDDYANGLGYCSKLDGEDVESSVHIEVQQNGYPMPSAWLLTHADFGCIQFEARESG